MDNAGSSPVTGTTTDWNAYMRSYQKRRYAERSAYAIVQLGGSCVMCGSVEFLEFDHIDRSTKLFDVKQLLYKRSLDNEDLVNELAKCQLLCKPCHQQKTAAESTVGHGGGVAGVGNCPCELCKSKKRSYMRQRNQNRCRRNNCSCEKRHFKA